MKAFLSLALAAALLAAWPVTAQQQGRDTQWQKQGVQPRERMRDERREFRRERRQSVISTFCPAEGDKKIFSFDKSSFPQAFAKCFDHALGFVGRAAAEKSDD